MKALQQVVLAPVRLVVACVWAPALAVCVVRAAARSMPAGRDTIGVAVGRLVTGRR